MRFLDYTDIPDKLTEIKSDLYGLYSLVYIQYDGVFKGEDAEKYQRMLQNIDSADSCIEEVNDINNRLSNIFEAQIAARVSTESEENMTKEKSCVEPGFYPGMTKDESLEEDIRAMEEDRKRMEENLNKEIDVVEKNKR